MHDHNGTLAHNASLNGSGPVGTRSNPYLALPKQNTNGRPIPRRRSGASGSRSKDATAAEREAERAEAQRRAILSTKPTNSYEAVRWVLALLMPIEHRTVNVTDEHGKMIRDEHGDAKRKKIAVDAATRRTAKLVLAQVADEMHGDSICRISKTTLAKMTHLSRQKLSEIYLRMLIETGYLRKKDQPQWEDTRQYKWSEYELVFPPPKIEGEITVSPPESDAGRVTPREGRDIEEQNQENTTSTSTDSLRSSSDSDLSPNSPTKDGKNTKRTQDDFLLQPHTQDGKKEKDFSDKAEPDDLIQTTEPCHSLEVTRAIGSPPPTDQKREKLNRWQMKDIDALLTKS